MGLTLLSHFIDKDPRKGHLFLLPGLLWQKLNCYGLTVPSSATCGIIAVGKGCHGLKTSTTFLGWWVVSEHL